MSTSNGCQICNCSSLGLPNTGFDCTFLIGVPFKFLFTPTYASDGTKNRIAVGSTLNQAFFDALINHADASKRLYPSPQINNVALPRAETKFFTTNAGSKQKIQQGIRSLEALFLNVSGTGEASPQILGSLSSMNCGAISTYIVSLDNQILGKVSGDGLYLEPYQMDSGSIDPVFVWPNGNDSVQGIQFNFDFSLIEKDANIRMFDCNEVGGADLLGLRGLMPVEFTMDAISENGFTAVATTPYGTLKNPGKFIGGVQADFSIHNDTDDTDVPFTVTEDPDGTYEFVFDTPLTPGDEFTLSMQKTGYEGVDNTDEVPTS